MDMLVENPDDLPIHVPSYRLLHQGIDFLGLFPCAIPSSNSRVAIHSWSSSSLALQGFCYDLKLIQKYLHFASKFAALAVNSSSMDATASLL